MLDAQIYEDELGMAEATIATGLFFQPSTPAGKELMGTLMALAEIIVRSCLRGKCMKCEDQCDEFEETVVMGSIADEVREQMLDDTMLTPKGSEN